MELQKVFLYFAIFVDVAVVVMVVVENHSQ